ncbi:MAG: hypothetical protein WC730_03130 [Patescibacteria group bacterium]|jgi:hypothetical protein
MRSTKVVPEMPPSPMLEPTPTVRSKHVLALAIMVPIVILLLVLSFVSGLYFAKWQAGVEDTEEDEIVNDDDGKGDLLTEGTPLSIDWWGTEMQDNVDLNPLLIEAYSQESDSGTFLEEESFSKELGIVTSGTFDGYLLTENVIAIQGMGVTFSYLYILEDVVDREDAVLLSRYSTQVFNDPSMENEWDPQLSTIDSTDAFYIPELEMEEQVTDEAGVVYDYLGVANMFGLDSPDMDEDATNVLTAPFATLTNGDLLYRVKNEGKYQHSFLTLSREDQRIAFYEVNIPFWNDEMGFSAGFLEITWNDGMENSELYSRAATSGCGMENYTNVVDDVSLEDMEVVGTTVAGDIYAPVDYDLDRYQTDYDLWALYTGVGKTFEEYTDGLPYLYWEDALGRIVEFRATDIRPVSECGKPVIYLYPEERTEVTVLLDPKGGFSFTEPDYGLGWNVMAEPNGTLTNLADGEVYPYLFWEGKGGLYEAPKQYWVVAQADVESFLTSTLAQLGLNEKETADFMDFWYPRMQGSAYYQIGFHGTGMMNHLAPMDVTPAPDTVIRILMDYQPLDESIEANPPTLPKTPVRQGFTVVEWGGVIQ